MLRIGLTGSIATGKSYVLSIFRQLGCHTIDADQIARAVVEPGQPAYQDIVHEFGPGILTAAGDIDRERLGHLVFHDPQKRQRLNAIVHPRLLQEIERRLSGYEAADPTGLVVVDGALIIEAGVQPLFDKLVVVHCQEEEQVQRLMRRDGLSREDAVNRIQSQMSSPEKLKFADFEVDTSGSFEQTRLQVERIYQQLCRQTRSQRHTPGSQVVKVDPPT